MSNAQPPAPPTVGAQTIRVTYLELRESPPPAALRRGPESIRLETLSAAEYLDLYRRVGGPLQWDTRLSMAVGELETLLAGTGLHVYVVREGAVAREGGTALGFCEFDRRALPDIELKHFGLIPQAQGRGLGPWLLSTALEREWASGAERIWLHTDDWDHPAAVPVYRRAGFRVFDIRHEPPEGL